MNCAKLLIASLVLSILGSCSFNDIPSSARAQFAMPDLQSSERPLATYACLNVWGPDGRWNSQVKTMSRRDRSLSVEFEVPYLWVGRQYTFRVLGFNTDPSLGVSTYTCPTGSSSTELTELGILENKLITKDVTQVIISAHSGLGAADFCGGLDKSCYATSFDNKTSATLIDGTSIEREANPLPGIFPVWKEKNGTRILKATGLWANDSDWQRKLIPTGRDFISNSDPRPYFTDVNNIAGRTCPKNVYFNDANKQGGGCLYYTTELPSTSLMSDNGAEAQDFLSSWASPVTGNGINASYYEGNIKSCNNLGMRLPTLFEFKLTSEPPPNDVPGDITPDFDTLNGIPTQNGAPAYLTATAAKSSGNTLFFMVLNSTPNIVPTTAGSEVNGKLICVLPSNEN